MSTDYGFGCVECKIVREIENARSFNAGWLAELLKNIEAVGVAVDLGFRSSENSFYGIGPAVEFAREHVRLGHTVKVCSEYGDYVDECNERTRCRDCGGWQKSCGLPLGHEGPCVPKDVQNVDHMNQAELLAEQAWCRMREVAIDRVLTNAALKGIK